MTAKAEKLLIETYSKAISAMISFEKWHQPAILRLWILLASQDLYIYAYLLEECANIWYREDDPAF